MKVMTKTKGKIVERQETQSAPPPMDTREWLKEAMERIELTWYEASPKLAEVHATEQYKEWGFPTFQEYTEKDLGLDYRLAMYRVLIGRAIVKFEITAEQVKEIGWTKFKEICALMTDNTTKKEADTLLRKIENMTFREVQDFVKTERVHNEGGAQTRKVKMNFTFTDEQASIIETAISEAKSLANTDNDNLALEYICAEWSLNHDISFAEKMQEKITKRTEEIAKAKKPVKHKKHANAGKKKAKVKKGE